MTKVINYLMAAAVSMTSVSAIAAHTCGNFSGFYAGVTGGYGMGHSKLNAVDGQYTGATTSNGTTTSGYNTPGTMGVVSLGLKGFNGGVFLGYGKLFPNKVYLGFEANAGFNRVKNGISVFPASAPVKSGPDGNGVTTTTIDKDNKSYQAERREAFGGALRLGGIMGAGMLTYAKIGVESAKWRLSVLDGDTVTTSTSAGTNGTPAATGPTATGTLFPGSKNQRLTGIVLGLGMETMISEHVSLGGEYTFTTYTGSFGTDNIPANTVTTSGDTTTISNFRPRTSDFRLRIAYKW